MSAELDAEIDRNLFAFQTMVSDLMRKHAGHYALLRKQSLISVHQALGAAILDGHERYDDGLFSIQRVTDKPIDLGFFSHAAYPG